MTRRDLLSSGTFGALAGVEQQTPPVDPRLMARIETRLEEIGDQFEVANAGSFTGTSQTVEKLRDAMVTFLRGHQKYPDYIDVGYLVFHLIYDWHVRNRQPLTVGRNADGRYGLMFMFTRLLLRADAVPDFIGVPYDQRA